jgi:hypothetical protein
VPFLNGIRDTVIRDKARTRLYQEARKEDIQDKTLGRTGRHQWNMELRIKTAATSEKEYNQQWHQRMEQETGAKSGKQDNTQEDFQEDCRAGDRKANSRDFH